MHSGRNQFVTELNGNGGLYRGTEVFVSHNEIGLIKLTNVAEICICLTTFTHHNSDLNRDVRTEICMKIEVVLFGKFSENPIKY